MEAKPLRFAGYMKDEQVQFFFRKHWVRFLRPAIFSLVVGFLVFSMLYMWGTFVINVPILFIREIYAFFVMMVAITYLHLFFFPLINYYFDLVLVTDYRILIVKKTVFLRNDNDAIDLTKIQDIGVQAHGIIQNYLNYGHLEIILSTSTPPIDIPYVPDPHYYLEWCNRVKRDYITRRRQKSYLTDLTALNSG